MNNAQIRLTPRFSGNVAIDAIEWEELPSLAGQVPRAANHATPAWLATMPAALVEQTPTTPFREPMRGLVVREVNEPDVFRHFFG
jgi:hypothetical protein